MQPSGRGRRDAPMSLNLVGSPDAESRHEGSVFGGSTPLSKTVKTTSAPCDRINSCRSRWDDRTGPKHGGHAQDYPRSLDAEFRLERSLPSGQTIWYVLLQE